MLESDPNSEIESPELESEVLIDPLPKKAGSWVLIKTNFPAIALVSGAALLVFMAAATIGLIGFILINRPTPDQRLEQVDLSRITSDIALDSGTLEAADYEIVEGAAPGLFKLERTEASETEKVAEIAPAGRVLPGGQTFTNISILPELPASYYESRLRKNISSSSAPPPSLEHSGHEDRGPQRVQFIIGETGKLHDHALGTASFAETDIVGAAGEWQVRPWWQPAWIPQSVDCGNPGTVSIGGHVSWSSVPGPFHDLGTLSAGDRIRCQAQSGAWFTYEVSEVVQIGYNNTDYYWETRSNLNEHQLTLFTCKPEITGIIVVRAQLIDL